MKKNNFIYGILSALVLSIGFVSCATGTVYFKDSSKYTTTPFLYEVDWDYYKLSWSGYQLISDEETMKKTVDFAKYGMNDYQTKSGLVSDFKKKDKFLYEVKFITGVKEKNKDNYFEDNLETYIVIDNTKLSVEISKKEEMIDDNSFMPIKVTRISKVLREGKVYDLPGSKNSGVKINLYGQDYAVIDFITENPTIYLNSNFNKDLTTEEEMFAAALLLSMYELNNTNI